MIKQKLEALSKDVKKSKKNLETKLKQEKIALNQQRYLIETVLEKCEINKKQTFNKANRDLLNLQIEKWVRKRNGNIANSFSKHSIESN